MAAKRWAVATSNEPFPRAPQPSSSKKLSPPQNVSRRGRQHDKQNQPSNSRPRNDTREGLHNHHPHKDAFQAMLEVITLHKCVQLHMQGSNTSACKRCTESGPFGIFLRTSTASDCDSGLRRNRNSSSNVTLQVWPGTMRWKAGRHLLWQRMKEEACASGPHA